MDLKALIAKMDQIEGKKFLTEATKTDKPWTDKSGKEQSGTKVKGDKYTGKEADKEAKEKKVDEAQRHAKETGEKYKDTTDQFKGGKNYDELAAKKGISDLVKSTKEKKVKEAVKTDKPWTDKSGKEQSGTKVKGDKYTGKEADKEAKAKSKKVDEGINFKSSIANALLREFGLEEADTANPWANDPAKSAAWSALTPEDQAWLGGADPTDPYILNRAPNKGAPAAPTMPSATDPNDTRTSRDARDATSASDLAANIAAEKPADTMGTGPNPKMARFKELLDKAQGTMGKPAAPKAVPTAPKAVPAVSGGGRPAFPTPNISGQNLRASS
jgi:hypothetical protein